MPFYVTFMSHDRLDGKLERLQSSCAIKPGSQGAIVSHRTKLNQHHHWGSRDVSYFLIQYADCSSQNGLGHTSSYYLSASLVGDLCCYPLDNSCNYTQVCAAVRKDSTSSTSVGVKVMSH